MALAGQADRSDGRLTDGFVNKSSASSNRTIIFVDGTCSARSWPVWLRGSGGWSAHEPYRIWVWAPSRRSPQTIIGDIISPEAITVMLRDEQGSGARAIGSHAAIVAREYGVPAVMGTGDGTHKLSDGGRVRVDGDRSLVFATAVPTAECEGRSSRARGCHERRGLRKPSALSVAPCSLCWHQAPLPAWFPGGNVLGNTRAFALLGTSAGGGRFAHRRGRGRADPTRSHDSSWKASELLRPSRRPSIWSSAASTVRPQSDVRGSSRDHRRSSLALGQLILLAYAVAVWIAVASFVHFYEEPALSRRFSTRYEAYRRAVPGWWPHLHRGKPASVTARAHDDRPAGGGRKSATPAGVRPHDLGASPAQSLCRCLVGSLNEAVCHGSPLCAGRRYAYHNQGWCIVTLCPQIGSQNRGRAPMPFLLRLDLTNE